MHVRLFFLFSGLNTGCEFGFLGDEGDTFYVSQLFGIIGWFALVALATIAENKKKRTQLKTNSVRTTKVKNKQT